jgi:hypothetical protein
VRKNIQNSLIKTLLTSHKPGQGQLRQDLFWCKRIVMNQKQLRNSLTRFSKCGTLEDLDVLIRQLASRALSDFSLDLDLRVALRVGERCLLLQQGVSMLKPILLVCLSLFLHDHSYASAQAFANSFLTSGAGRQAFMLSARCIAACTDPDADLLNHSLQFLSSALWHESQVVYVLRTQTETYRIAFACVARWSTALGPIAWNSALKLFHFILYGRKEGPAHSSHYEDELLEALPYLVICGGLTAFSAMFWTICNRTDCTVLPEDATSVANYCDTLITRIMQSEFTGPVNEVQYHWLATEASNTRGIMAGFYALFAALEEIYRATHSDYPLIAVNFVVLLGERGSKDMVDQAIKFPHSGCDTFPAEETWLYRCLQATRKLGVPSKMQAVVDCMQDTVKGIPWAEQAIQLFVNDTEHRQASKSESRCAFLGCVVVGTTLCPLRRCGRCLNVHYCTPAHQRAHWPMHRKACAVPSSVVIASDVDTAPTALSGVVAIPSTDGAIDPDTGED